MVYRENLNHIGKGCVNMSKKNAIKKLKYESPTVVPLGELATGSGYCAAGNSAGTGYCDAGIFASGGYCSMGTSAIGGYCRAGLLVGGNCVAGTLGPP
jgi:hypothetical protein